MTPELFWIPGPWRGRLAIAGRPRGDDWLADELRGLREAGIDVVVSLLEPEEAVELGLEPEAVCAASSGLSYVSLPIPDRGLPTSTPSAIRLAAELESAVAAGKNVAVHCRQGVGRAGVIAAAVLIAAGIEPGRAIDAVSAARGQQVPETIAQRDWLLQLPALVSLGGVSPS